MPRFNEILSRIKHRQEKYRKEFEMSVLRKEKQKHEQEPQEFKKEKP